MPELTGEPSTGSTTTTDYVPNKDRSGIALCLSGGGYRAALFHLGALRRLDELGILSAVTTVSSVSGGSILAAHVAQRLRPWPPAGLCSGQWEAVAASFRRFAARNIRTWPILRRLLPWNLPRKSTGVKTLAKIYQARLTGLMLDQLPDHPRFVFCATDMAYGVNWVFERSRMGDYQVGYIRPPPRAWPVGRAVAASSCFPPIFNPLPIREDPGAFRRGKAPMGPKRDECLSDLRLTDGGNYDNMGLEPVWKDHAVLLVSDGGATFDFHSDKNLIWRLSRYAAIQGNQAAAVRKRWLIAGFARGEFEGTYWGIGSSTASYSDPPVRGYPKQLAKETIAEIRTDLDAFSEGEAKVLENHGYSLCEAAVQRHMPHVASPSALPFVIPYEEWMDEGRVRAALATSHRIRLPFGRW
jgi:NTE family protein